MSRFPEIAPRHTVAHDASLDETARGLDALLHSVAVAPIQNIGWIHVSGEDRVRWLNGMLTNAVQALRPGEGCYNFALNAQGRIQADANVFALDDALLIESNRAPELSQVLDRFIIMDDVELKLLPPESRAGLLVAGPHAGAALARALGASVASEPGSESEPRNASEPGMLHLRQVSALDLVTAHAPLVPRFELWGTPVELEAVRATLDAPVANPQSLECLRQLEGTPVYGIDLRDKELPQETGQTRALHFSKGCYLGQEIVERIRSRGSVHRIFAGFELVGALPAAGTPLFAEDAASDPGARPVGELTSFAVVPLGGGSRQLAMGYVRRETLDRGQAVLYRSAEGLVQGRATPSVLPHRML